MDNEAMIEYPSFEVGDWVFFSLGGGFMYGRVMDVLPPEPKGAVLYYTIQIPVQDTFSTIRIPYDTVFHYEPTEEFLMDWSVRVMKR